MGKATRPPKGKFKMKSKLMLLAVSLSLAACVSVGSKIDTTKVTAFEKGKTTKAEVIAALGTPQTFGTQSDGKTIISYYYSKATPNAASFIPVVNIFAGKTKGELSLVTIVFTPDDKMDSYTATQSNSTVNMNGEVK